jgi:hypothetical protein
VGCSGDGCCLLLPYAIVMFAVEVHCHCYCCHLIALPTPIVYCCHMLLYYIPSSTVCHHHHCPLLLLSLPLPLPFLLLPCYASDMNISCHESPSVTICPLLHTTSVLTVALKPLLPSATVAATTIKFLFYNGMYSMLCTSEKSVIVINELKMYQPCLPMTYQLSYLMNF